ncbi:hypothetical protein BAUCODRAFT_33958 [Baudoinia panamericana UAMH 10762]|uniref:Uncharacterized protein n=1 Tax=Baudoinia panamericana (strain UAMH 10762) TaxID=717646 RepID=M2NBR7_BAUPA|nr:uncharacterized protein BAUCODRAFT_33958 [Baudoinia panamericana UAMH 10762]EMC96594.1 hypothetical protein BAUCODRAFT_33958 [Baudoinia panamericana UAMH 10762]
MACVFSPLPVVEGSGCVVLLPGRYRCTLRVWEESERDSRLLLAAKEVIGARVVEASVHVVLQVGMTDLYRPGTGRERLHLGVSYLCPW